MSDLQIVSIHALGITDPDAEFVTTGAWHPDGTPVMKKQIRILQPGTVFSVTWLNGGASEAHELIETGAARHLNDDELRIFTGSEG